MTVAEGPVVVVPYDAEWPRRFERERALLERVLVPWLEGGIHHVGATGKRAFVVRVLASAGLQPGRR